MEQFLVYDKEQHFKFCMKKSLSNFLLWNYVGTLRGNYLQNKFSNFKTNDICRKRCYKKEMHYLYIYSILVNNRLYTPPNEDINWPLWPGFVKNLPSNGWFNYSNNGIKHYLIKENHRLYTQ
jgi:hypothetical protein